MNKRICFSLLSVLSVLTSGGNVLADPPSCDNTWTGGSGGVWQDPTKWSQGYIPDDSQVACITSGATVQVWYAASGQCRAGAIYIDSTSTVRVRIGDNLTLCAGSSCVASQIDGNLEIYKNGEVILGQSMTMNGSGTIMFGYSGTGTALIEAGSRNPTLTMGAGLTLQGHGDIDVIVTNNGTVLADSGMLKLVQGGDGSGIWTAEGGAGHLLIQAEVKGAGTWRLDDHAGAKIEIDAACECLTGNVQVTLGTLDADANFRTTGQLTMGGSDSLIDVASTKSAKFSLGSLPSCVGGGGGSE